MNGLGNHDIEAMFGATASSGYRGAYIMYRHVLSARSAGASRCKPRAIHEALYALPFIAIGQRDLEVHAEGRLRQALGQARR